MVWKLLAGCVGLLVVALILEGAFDSKTAAWIALIAMLAFVPIYWSFRLWAWRRVRAGFQPPPPERRDVS